MRESRLTDMQVVYLQLVVQSLRVWSIELNTRVRSLRRIRSFPYIKKKNCICSAKFVQSFVHPNRCISFIIAIIGIIWPRNKHPHISGFKLKTKQKFLFKNKRSEKKTVVRTIKSQCVIKSVAIRRVDVSSSKLDWPKERKIWQRFRHGGIEESALFY